MAPLLVLTAFTAFPSFMISVTAQFNAISTPLIAADSAKAIVVWYGQIIPADGQENPHG